MVSLRRIFSLAVLPAVLLAFAANGAERWQVYKDCRLVENPANDGDSFHVKTARYKYLFRLYFADCPETDDLFPERIKEQAEHFGVPEETVLRTGELAREFTNRFLAGGFTVYTLKQDARGMSKQKRYFAVVKAGEKDLAEELVKRGLARAYGAGVDLPDGTDEHRWRAKLGSAERSARAMRVGIWRESRALAPPRDGGGD